MSNDKKQNNFIASLVDTSILFPAIKESFTKLDPRCQLKNPVMFVTELGAVMTTVYAIFGIGCGLEVV